MKVETVDVGGQLAGRDAPARARRRAVPHVRSEQRGRDSHCLEGLGALRDKGDRAARTGCYQWKDVENSHEHPQRLPVKRPRYTCACVTTDLQQASGHGNPSAAPGDCVSVARKERLRRLRKAVVLLRQPAWRRAARSGVAAAVEHRDVPFGPNFATIIDVGAHHGQFSLLMRVLYPNADIVCVEPLPDAISRLHAVHSGDDRLTIVPFAAAAEEAHRSLHVSRKTDSSSLLPILESYVNAFPGTDEARTIEVEARPLDDLLERDVRRPALLKIDAQGGELDVVAGAAVVLEQVDAAFVECSFVEFYRGQALADQVIGAFLRHNLRLDGVFSVVRDDRGRCLQADLLFRRSRDRP
ncbi:MAG TPA: FkbM family methyltransferase [Solirubrobacteraceae bacterium]